MKFIYSIIFLVCFLVTQQATAGTLKGKVVDIETGEYLTGAIILDTNDHSINSLAGLDGSFVIKNLDPGTYQLEVRFISYETQVVTVTINSSDEVKNQVIKLAPVTTQIEGVTVVGNFNTESNLYARHRERTSENVLNVISSKTISLLPDLDVANVVQRVSGVSLEHGGSSSGSTYVIIRGISKRYNYTLINGIKIPSPDDKNRYVPLDIFPSSLVDRVEVIKSLTPSMEGDAIGGVVNMVMKKAPEKLTIHTDLSMGYHELFINNDFKYFDAKAINDLSPFQEYGYSYQASQDDFTTRNLEILSKQFAPDINASFSVGNRFFNNKLGGIVAISYSKEHKGANSTRFTPELLVGTSLPKLTGMSTRSYYNDVQRIGIHTNFDYSLNSRNILTLYAAYMNLNENQLRDMIDVSVLGSANILDSDRKTYETRFMQTTQQISNVTLQGEHVISERDKIKWSMVSSIARKDKPDEAYFVRITNLSLASNQESILIAEDNDNKRIWRYNKDVDNSAYLDYTHSFSERKAQQLSFGGLYRLKNRNSFYNAYNFMPSPGIQAYGYDWQPDDASLTYSTWEKYEDVTFKVGNPTGSTTNEFNHDFTENLIAAYMQLKFDILDKVEILGGARLEKTDWSYTLLAPRPSQDPEGGRNFSDILPSVHVKYKLNNHSNLRASYFYSVIRPGYYEILPYFDKGEDYTEIGNPDIRRTKANNFDLRYENFFTPEDQIMIGTFYKQINDPIEYARFEGKTTWSGLSEWVRMPSNFGTATNYGFETDFIKYFRSFGIKLNYTYTHSEITQSKQIQQRKNPNDPSSEIITVLTTQTRPLQGQAKHIGNASLLYKNQKRKIDGQLAFVYTGERILNVSNYVDNDEWEMPLTRVDFSLEKGFGKFTVFVKAKNLMDTPYRVIIKQPLREDNVDFPLQGELGDNYLIRRDLYKRSFRIGFKLNI